MIITFVITVKISCILEFSFDLQVKINNKENIILPINGTVVEPKIIINPKSIYVPRIPCNMVTYIPINVTNVGPLKSSVEVLDLGADHMLDIYAARGNDKYQVSNFTIEPGSTKQVFAKVTDDFRREYDTFLPFRVNGLLGPPTENVHSMDMQYYIGEYESQYSNNARTKLKAVHKEISYCKIYGVICLPWIKLSVQNFELNYTTQDKNYLEFSMTNISKHVLPVTIQISKILPNFSLHLASANVEVTSNENFFKFDLDKEEFASFIVKFHPKGHGRFVATALFYLDKALSIPYSNLTFVGKRDVPLMTVDTSRIIFAPCLVNSTNEKILEINLHAASDVSAFSYVAPDEEHLDVTFLYANIYSDSEAYTILKVKLKVTSDSTYSRSMTINFHHDSGSSCEVQISFTFASCPLTLHATQFISKEENPYPLYPDETQLDFFNYMETTLSFLEKWMFQQGFRRELYPEIPDTFHSISTSLSSQGSSMKSKGINVTILNFIKRIAGPMMKHVRKINVPNYEEPFKSVKEIHDTYRELIDLLRSRGADLRGLRAKFLLSYDQFVIYTENIASKSNTDNLLINDLQQDVYLYKRLNKQSWMDFILQTYKVFIMESCFFECVCISSSERDIIKILTDWYNSVAVAQHRELRGSDKEIKNISNITTDLTDGIVIISAILFYCPFLKQHFSIYHEVNEGDGENDIIHNACLIIEAMSIIRVLFPLTSTDFLQPNFIQMLFLSIHLYVVLPMFKPKDVVKFNPPLLKSSTRLLSISPTTQEALVLTFQTLNNVTNSFFVEKVSGDSGKKNYVSVKYTAKFVIRETATLLIHGYNKTRIFDTYIIFTLIGEIGSLNPFKKCKVSGPLYRPNKVDILISSPFQETCEFSVTLTDVEPTLPVNFSVPQKPKFYLQRLNLIDSNITLQGITQEVGQELIQHKLYMQLICLSTQIGNSWIWFRGEAGEFFVKVTTHPRSDIALDILQAPISSWPLDPCSCGEACECYRSTILMIPHKVDFMVKGLRQAFCEFASEAMLAVFDKLIETYTGRIILGKLFSEGGTNMIDVAHILRNSDTYRIFSRTMQPRLDRVTLHKYSCSILPLPVTLPPNEKIEKYTITLTSECALDMRTYRILFVENKSPGE